MRDAFFPDLVDDYSKHGGERQRAMELGSIDHKSGPICWWLMVTVAEASNNRCGFVPARGA